MIVEALEKEYGGTEWLDNGRTIISQKEMFDDINHLFKALRKEVEDKFQLFHDYSMILKIPFIHGIVLCEEENKFGITGESIVKRMFRNLVIITENDDEYTDFELFLIAKEPDDPMASVKMVGI